MLPWIIWTIALLTTLFFGGMAFGSYKMTHRQGRILLFPAIIGLVIPLITSISKYHLLWYFPVIILISVFIAYKDLLRLNRNIDKVWEERPGDVDHLMKGARKRIDDYNKNKPPDEQLR